MQDLPSKYRHQSEKFNGIVKYGVTHYDTLRGCMKNNFIMSIIMAMILVFSGSTAMAHTHGHHEHNGHSEHHGHHTYFGVGYGWYGSQYYYAPPYYYQPPPERVIVVHDSPPVSRPHWVPGHSFTDSQHIVRVPGHWEYPDDEPGYLDRLPQDRDYGQNKNDDIWNDTNSY